MTVPGKMHTVVTLWDNHALDAADLSPGSYVSIENLRGKLSKGFLEAVSHSH